MLANSPLQCRLGSFLHLLFALRFCKKRKKTRAGALQQRQSCDYRNGGTPLATASYADCSAKARQHSPLPSGGPDLSSKYCCDHDNTSVGLARIAALVCSSDARYDPDNPVGSTLPVTRPAVSNLYTSGMPFGISTSMIWPSPRPSKCCGEGGGVSGRSGGRSGDGGVP